MYSICVFYYLFFLYCLPTLEAGKCGDDEFFFCGPECDNECSTLHEMNRTNCPILNIVCNEKCYCEDGYARDDEGQCIPIEECPSSYYRQVRSPKSHIHREPLLCPPNEEYAMCKRSCPPDTCISLVARFKCDSREQCIPGCACKSGFLRQNADGPCTPIRECPQLASSPDFL
ncbi:unnamed protein product [Pieris brassicae]|uniref:TIL domain-containing protein n=1 Tax=Pieris brassicae TaxID=7116 RepID=A0A9P0T714_PIEBR|nr:unnamed protein product [Pieris brassicae]